MSFLKTTLASIAALTLAIAGCSDSSPDKGGKPGGGGKADGASCVFGSTYGDAIDAGIIAETSSKTYFSADEILNDGPSDGAALLGKQIIAAALESTEIQYTAVAQVFEASEGTEVTVIELLAQDGTTYRAIRFYPGGNPYGAIFVSGGVEVAAVFQDDDITECNETGAPTCAFGESYGDSIDAGTMTETSSKTYFSADEILNDGPSPDAALLGKQIIAAALESTEIQYTAVAQVFEASEATEVTVIELTGNDGSKYRAIRFYPGGNPYGAIFVSGTVDVAAVFQDDDITECNDTGAQTCTFGDTYGESIDAGTVTETKSQTYFDADELLNDGPSEGAALLGEQIIAAALESTGIQYTAVAEVFEASEANEVTVVELSAADGATYRAIRFYPGGNPYGAIFVTGTVEVAAVFQDDDITACNK
ncbi:MAG: hypothetical protein AB7O24_07390 [Kofleriaceae bacterium]